MVLPQQDLITVDGIPVHPLLVHAVVVLLPLAALGGLVIALRASWRRRFGLVVLLLTIAGVAAVPLATTTGGQLRAVLPANPAIDAHMRLGDTLLPFAIAFGVAVLLLVLVGWQADREREASIQAAAENGGSRTWRRLAIVAAALVAFTGVAETVQVVRIGHSGSVAVWQGVGAQR